MKFRKKPVVIEALQLKKDNVKDIYEFIYGAGSVKLTSSIDNEKWDEYVSGVRNNGMRLKTLESDGETQVASIGDWIIKGIQGEFYPCKPDIFEDTYEKAE